MGRNRDLLGLVSVSWLTLVGATAIEGFRTKLVPDAQEMSLGDELPTPHVDGLARLEAKCDPKSFDTSEKLNSLGFGKHD